MTDDDRDQVVTRGAQRATTHPTCSRGHSSDPPVMPFGETPSSGRNPDGTFASGNTAPLTHGGRSRRVRAAQLPQQAEIRELLADKRAAILADLGGDAKVSRLQRDLVERYLELDIVATWLGGNLVAEGPLTAKGRTRAALSAYESVADRLLRLATALGLDRHPKKVALADHLSATYRRRDAVSSTDESAS